MPTYALKKSALLTVLCLIATAVAAQTKPVVVLIATGGTIAMKIDPVKQSTQDRESKRLRTECRNRILAARSLAGKTGCLCPGNNKLSLRAEGASLGIGQSDSVEFAALCRARHNAQTFRERSPTAPDRGKPKHQQHPTVADTDKSPDTTAEFARRRRASWARLIHRIFEADPLLVGVEPR